MDVPAVNLHGWSADHARLARRARRADPRPLPARTRRSGGRRRRPTSPSWRRSRADGLGARRRARRLVDDVLLPNNVALDHERFLAYIPAAPATTAALFDAVVGAWSFSGESWQEAGAAVAAENAALDWLRSLAGLPARRRRLLRVRRLGRQPQRPRRGPRQWRRRHPVPAAGHRLRAVGPLVGAQRRPPCSTSTSSRSPATSATGSPASRLAMCRRGRSRAAPSSPAPAPPTPAPIDDLAGVADVCADARRRWFHVDAAYGGAALRRPGAGRPVRRHRARRLGRHRPAQVAVRPARLRRACCTAIRLAAARTHRQSAAYLDAFGEARVNPSDLAFHLTRRPAGLPLWFIARGPRHRMRFAAAVRAGACEHGAGEAPGRSSGRLRRRPVRSCVMEPELSVVLSPALRRLGLAGRLTGRAGAARGLRLTDGLAFVAPTH